MMRVLFDYQAFYIQKYGGISRYITNLYNGLNQNPETKAQIALLYSDNFYANNILPSSGHIWKQKLFKNRGNRTKRWNKRYTNFTLPFRNFDIFHPTYYDPYFIKNVKKPVVITVHDMIHEKFPHYFDDAKIITANKKKVLERADAIIAISQSTYNDLTNIFGIDKSKVRIVHHGINNLATSRTQSNFQHPNKYVLFVGERWSYKNFISFIEAYSTILNQDKELNLVCAGGRAFTPQEQSLFSKLGITNQCHQYNATDEELQDLYQNAICFIFPSQYEGFGLPILESFAANCPVLLSNTSCFSEIGGNAALYFDPYNKEDIQEQLSTIIYNQPLRQELVNLGKVRLNLFSMEKCINKTIDIYKELLP